MWRFPKSWGHPQSSSTLIGFSILNPPAVGDPTFKKPFRPKEDFLRNKDSSVALQLFRTVIQLPTSKQSSCRGPPIGGTVRPRESLTENNSVRRRYVFAMSDLGKDSICCISSSWNYGKAGSPKERWQKRETTKKWRLRSLADLKTRIRIVTL